jgi:hypothetical protein
MLARERIRDVIAGSHDRSGSMSWYSLRQPPAQPEEGDGFVLFEGEVKRAAEALVAASAVLGADIEPENVFPPDEAGDDEADGAEFNSRMLERLTTLKKHNDARDELAELLVGRLVVGEEERAPDVELRTAREQVESAGAEVAGLLRIDRDKALRRGREVAEGAVAERLREVALERYDISLHLVRHRDGRPGAVWYAVPRETASVWLLGSLYPRVEGSVTIHTLLNLERQASHWYFLRWSTERRGEEVQFTQQVREQEWSLVDRPALVTGGVPIMAAFCAQPIFESVPPRQQMLARSLSRSFVGVFTFRGEEDGVHIFESAVDGRRFRVHEHNPENHYPPGSLGLGRLIPWEGGLHLRSPGMVIIANPSPDLPARMADALTKAEELDMPPAIALEAMTSMLLMNAKVPRRVKPAENRAQAEELAQLLPELLEEHGLAREASEDDPDVEVPDEMRAIAQDRDVKLMQYRVDQAMAEWMGELHKMASPAGAPGGSPAGGPGKPKKGKNKKKRRR